ncbi:MAG: STAS/SEC14 domain-containing protein [Bacteroidales bacterium]
MNETIIFEDSYAVVKYVPDLHLIIIEWNGTLTNEQYRTAFLKALEFQDKCTATISNFMSDVRKQGIVNPDNRRWFETVALPRAIKQGLKRAAVVIDGNIFKKYYLNLVLKTTNKFRLPLKLFSTVDDAYSWLKSFDDTE